MTDSVGKVYNDVMGRAEAREQRQREILDVASAVIADEGPAALSMRRLAQDVGASTMVLYTLFESKEGLLDALVREGFERFAEALRAVDETDPWEHLLALGRAYRAYARAQPSYYRLMWEFRRRGDAPWSPGVRDEAFQALVAGMARVMRDLGRDPEGARPAALVVWAAVHGFVSLELQGGPGGEAAFEHLLDFLVAGLRGSDTP